MELIREWNTTNPNKGYNNSLGGESWNCSEETKKKMSEATIGENNPMYGKHHSEETRKKMSENHADVSDKNNPRAKSVICITTGKIFNTAKEGAEYYGIASTNIVKCCKGKLKSAGKYQNQKLVWKYLDNFLNECKYILL